jgi:hypothetical protein
MPQQRVWLPGHAGVPETHQYGWSGSTGRPPHRRQLHTGILPRCAPGSPSRRRFHVHYTPTYAFWLNQVERWFAIITSPQIRRAPMQSQGSSPPDQRLRGGLRRPLGNLRLDRHHRPCPRKTRFGTDGWVPSLIVDIKISLDKRCSQIESPAEWGFRGISSLARTGGEGEGA